MKKIISIVFLITLGFNSGLAFAVEKYKVKLSPYSVSESLDRLESILKHKGFTIFTRINHFQGAKKVGIQMPPTELLIFGNPKVGSYLMKEDPLMALDLPMKAMAWQDKKGQTRLAYIMASELQSRHNIKNQKLIDKIRKVLDGLTNKAISKQSLGH